MSEKHFGKSEEMIKADEQMTEKEIDELLGREMPEGEEMPEVSEEDLERAKEAVQKRMDEENPER